jgi:ferritin-like metal-binding protein YciE
MADSMNDQLLAWLNDAYSMEQSITQVLENHVKDAKNHARLQARIEQHLDETKRHAELVKQMIENHGGSTSSIKSGMAGMMGRLQGASTEMAKDELVKNALSDFSTEYFEIASYKALIAAATELGAQDVVQTCQRIIQDEESMAQFLDENLPMVVHETMQNEASA